MMFGQARQQIINLMRENKKNRAQLSDISWHETEAINEEIQWHLQDTEKKNQELEVKLDEALGEKRKCNSSRKGTTYKRERHAMQTPKHGEKTVLQVTLDESLHKNAEMLHKKE